MNNYYDIDLQSTITILDELFYLSDTEVVIIGQVTTWSIACLPVLPLSFVQSLIVAITVYIVISIKKINILQVCN